MYVMAMQGLAFGALASAPDVWAAGIPSTATTSNRLSKWQAAPKDKTKANACLAKLLLEKLAADAGKSGHEGGLEAVFGNERADADEGQEQSSAKESKCSEESEEGSSSVSGARRKQTKKTKKARAAKKDAAEKLKTKKASKGKSQKDAKKKRKAPSTEESSSSVSADSGAAAKRAKRAANRESKKAKKIALAEWKQMDVEAVHAAFGKYEEAVVAKEGELAAYVALAAAFSEPVLTAYDLQAPVANLEQMPDNAEEVVAGLRNILEDAAKVAGKAEMD